MGLMDQVFGGSQSVPLLSGPQQKFMSTMYKKINPTIGKAAPTYTGQTVAGIDPLMQRAYAGMPAAAMDNPALDPAITNQLTGVGDPAAVSAMYEASLGPARLEFNRALDTVGARYGDVWGRSGALPEMVGRTTAEYGMGLNKLLADLTYADRQQGLNRQAAAIPLAMAQRQNNMAANAGLYSMGEANRAIQQQQLLGDYNNWNASQWYNNPAIPLGQSMLGVQTQGYVQQPGVFNQVVGAGQGLANLAMSFANPAMGAAGAGGGMGIR